MIQFSEKSIRIFERSVLGSSSPKDREDPGHTWIMSAGVGLSENGEHVGVEMIVIGPHKVTLNITKKYSVGGGVRKTDTLPILSFEV